jgi:rare lipoprotein A
MRMRQVFRLVVGGIVGVIALVAADAAEVPASKLDPGKTLVRKPVRHKRSAKKPSVARAKVDAPTRSPALPRRQAGQDKAKVAKAFGQTGIASWYGGKRQEHLTASGENLDNSQMTAAHPTLPMHSQARVTNLANGRSVTVRVTDRGPHKKGRIIDVSQKAAENLGMKRSGVARVRVELLSPLQLSAAPSTRNAEPAE